MVILVIVLVILFVVSLFFDYGSLFGFTQVKSDNDSQSESEKSISACGLEGVCGVDCAVYDEQEEPEYYDDEYLDAYKGISSNAYNTEQVEEFEEVLTTMAPSEVQGWLHSLKLREIELPDDLKETAYMLIQESRSLSH